MSLQARVEVTPYYGQVEISDPNKRDYPKFETGEEKAVAIPECIAVVTRGDQEGQGDRGGLESATGGGRHPFSPSMTASWS